MHTPRFDFPGFGDGSFLKEPEPTRLRRPGPSLPTPPGASSQAPSFGSGPVGLARWTVWPLASAPIIRGWCGEQFSVGR